MEDKTPNTIEKTDKVLTESVEQKSEIEKKINSISKARSYYKQVDTLQKKIKEQKKIIATAQSKIENYNNKLAEVVNSF